jgi:type I restriction enzyme M protein
MEDLKADLKSIAASGWGPELIPDDDILQSQFPELLAEMEQKRLRLAELTALFAAADEEDYEDSDDTGVLPSDEVKALKGELKEASAQAKLAKKEKRNPSEFLARVQRAEQRLAKHKALEDEARQLKNDLGATEKKEEELVTAAREKIDRDEARRVILDRLHRLLMQTYEGYLRTDQRACLAALENLHAKYAVTSKDIEAKRDAKAERLKSLLSELGYE